MTLNGNVAYIAGAVAVGAIAWLGANVGAGLWPAPLGMIAPALSLGGAFLGSVDAGAALIPLVGSIPFLIVGIPLLSMRSRMIWPTLLFVGLLTVASALYFAAAWPYGVEFQGARYTAIAAAVNAAFGALCLLFCWRALRNRENYAHRYAAAFAPCAWLAYCAFPWLGETP